MMSLVPSKSLKAPLVELETEEPSPGIARVKVAAWPLLLGLTLFLGLTAVVVILAMSFTAGRLVYSLDDPYIHMAMAKHMANSGVWGVSAVEFSSSSSSPLWTLLLSAVYWMTGAREWTPLVLNVAVGSVALFVADRSLKDLTAAGRAVVLVLIVLVVPLTHTVFTGMEHTLHLLMALLFASRVEAMLNGKSKSWPVYLLGALLVFTRYEGMFMVLAAIALMASRRTFGSAVILLLVSLIGPIAYGLVSRHYGWYWLPNSVLLKSFEPGQTIVRRIALAYIGFASRFIDSPGLVMVPVVGVWAVLNLRRRQAYKPGDYLMPLFLITALLHLLLMPRYPGQWDIRYQAYLMGLGLLAVGRLIDRHYYEWRIFTKRRTPVETFALTAAGSLVMLPLVIRSQDVLIALPTASKNINEQQVQMGTFLRRYYNDGSAIALNDIGATTYFANILCIDLYGLANMEVARSKQANAFDSMAVDRITKDAKCKVALIYDTWFRGRIPKEWVKVGQWTIRDNIACGGTSVSFYAVDPAQRPTLERNLREFNQQHLPAAVFRLML